MTEPVAEPGQTPIELVDENDRHHRQNLISWWNQSRLADATALVVGAGALGNELVKNLALVGIGRVIVVDMDTIENSNLSRCVFFRAEDEGRLKAEVLAERASALNPGIEVIPVVGDVRLALGLGVFAECDVVLGGLDNREARLHINMACWKTSTPLVDGAIEGLLGMMRVFLPPESACYECTMSERDRDLLANRRTCALLSRDEMLTGKVPTTATSASVIAAMQVQEAVKLLHRNEPGSVAYTFGGKGFSFNGETHDSYIVTYGRKDDCMSHDTYAVASADRLSPEQTVAEALTSARATLGPEAVLDLEGDFVLAAECTDCNEQSEIMRPLPAVKVKDGECPTCGEGRQLHVTHIVDDSCVEMHQLQLKNVVAHFDVVTARVGMERRHYVVGDGDAIETLRSN
ncbi:MAG: ThiF family adenylyltransferase [Actinomycetes bacterium]